MGKQFLNIIYVALSATVIFSSCKEKDEIIVDEESGNVPSVYSGFDDVDIGGQVTRQDMLDDLITYVKSAHVEEANVILSEALMLEMFNDGTGFNKIALDSSDKKLGSKTESTFKTQIELLFADAASASEAGLASEGVAGVLTGKKADGVSTRTMLVDSSGFEYAQVVAKGLMGATFMYQAYDNYLSDIELDDNTDATYVEGKGTAQAHHWDEAYGYFTDGLEFPTDGTDRFWGNYSEKRDAIINSNEAIGNAFRAGRQAIVDGDNAEILKQLDLVKEEWGKVAVACVIHYLNSGKANFSNIDKYHALSECYGFMFGVKAAYGTSVVGDMIETFETKGLYNITEDDLTDMITELATAYGLTDVSSSL